MEEEGEDKIDFGDGLEWTPLEPTREGLKKMSYQEYRRYSFPEGKKQMKTLYGWAAVLIVEAIKYKKDAGKLFQEKNVLPQEKQMRAYKILRLPMIRILIYTIILIDLSLPFFESESYSSPRKPEEDSIVMLVEFFCVFFLGLQTLLEHYWLKEQFWKEKWKVGKLFLICLTFFELIVWAPLVLRGFYSFRISRVFRSFFLVEQGPRFRFIVENVWKSVSSLLDYLLFLGLYIFLFSVIGFFLFESDPNDVYFQSFDDSLISLFVLLTTANYPDVMEPAFNISKAYAIYFIIYIIIGLYLILNMVFASIYHQYQQQSVKELTKYLKKREMLLSKAFWCLDRDRDGLISIDDWNETISIVRPDLVKDQREILYVMAFSSICDAVRDVNHRHHRHLHDGGNPPADGDAGGGADGSETFFDISSSEDLFFDTPALGGNIQISVQNSFSLPMTLTQFKESCEYLDFQFVKSSIPRKYDPTLDPFADNSNRPCFFVFWSHVSRYAIWVNEKPFFLFLEYVLILLLVSLVVGFTYLPCFAKKGQFGYLPCEIELVCQAIVCNLLGVILIIKLIAIGPKEYWKSSWNRLDSLIVFVTLVGITLHLVAVLLGYRTTLFRWFQILCSLRLVKIFTTKDKFREIIETFLVLLPSLIPFFIVLFSVYYIWAILGMEFFWGKLYEGNPDLNNTAFAAAGYYNYNFNSYFDTLVVLFELMVVNNWQVIMFGVVAVTNKWSQFYFVLYYLLIVVVILNLILAFLVEAFIYKSKCNQQTCSWECEVQSYFQKAQNRVLGYPKYKAVLPQRLLRLFIAMFSVHLNEEQEESTQIENMEEEIEAERREGERREGEGREGREGRGREDSFDGGERLTQRTQRLRTFRYLQQQQQQQQQLGDEEIGVDFEDDLSVDQISTRDDLNAFFWDDDCPASLID